MIAVSFQTGIFDLDKKSLIEVNSGYTTLKGSQLALLGGEPELGDEFYVWNSLDEVIDLYVDQAVRGGGSVIHNERLIGGKQLIKVDIPALGERINAVFEVIE